MGIYDRDYYREDEPSAWQSWNDRRVTITLLIAVGATFVIQVLASNPALRRPDQLLKFGAFNAEAILQGELWRTMTQYFIHSRSGLIQVAVEMVVLYVFGMKLERRLGSREYAFLLVACGLVVAVGKLLTALAVPEELTRASYGGGPFVAALVVLYIFYYGQTRVQFIAEVPAWVPAVIVLVLELLGEFGDGGVVGFGFVGYAVGAAFAVLYYFLPVRLSALFKRRPKRTTNLRLVRSQQDAASEMDDSELLAFETNKPAKVRGKSESTDSLKTAAALDEHLEAKLDQVLEKIARTGKDSLTADEQALLLHAGEVFKRRRAGRANT